MYVLFICHILDVICALKQVQYYGFEEESKDLHYINISHAKLVATEIKSEQEAIIAEAEKKTNMSCKYINTNLTLWRNNVTNHTYLVRIDTEKKEYELTDEIFLNLDNDYLLNLDVVYHNSILKSNGYYYKLNVHRSMGELTPLSTTCLVNPMDEFYLGNYYNYDCNDDDQKYEMVKNIIRSLLEAVKYLQHFGIIHTKIMPSSVMCYKDSENKIFFKLSCLHDAIILVKNGCDPEKHSETCQKDPNEMICEYFKFEDNWDIGYTALVLYKGIDVPIDQLNSNGKDVLFRDNIKTYLTKHKIVGPFYEFLLKCLLFSSSRKISAENLLQGEYFH